MTAHRDFRLLSYFVNVVRAGSIRGAAERLSISPAVVSEALTELEALLDVTLLQRSTRSMKLTAAGRAVFEPAADMVMAAEAALRLGSDAAQRPSGTVRMTISGELCLSWLPARLRRFERLQPAVKVEVTIDDSPMDLASSDFDLAVRATFALRKGDVERAIDDLPLECVCAPSLIGKSESLRARLSRIGIIGPTAGADGLRKITTLPLAGTGRRAMPLDVPCRFRSKDHVAAHRLALEGFGAAILMAPTVAGDLEAGRLVRVSDKHAFGYAALTILMRDRRPTAAARSLQQHLLAAPEAQPNTPSWRNAPTSSAV